MDDIIHRYLALLKSAILKSRGAIPEGSTFPVVFNPPITQSTIRHIENTIRLRLPYDLVELYKVHNGVGCMMPVFYDGIWLPLEHAIGHYKIWCRVFLESKDPPSTLDGLILLPYLALPQYITEHIHLNIWDHYQMDIGVKPIPFSRGWIPFLIAPHHYYYFIDTDPDTEHGGVIGQVVCALLTTTGFVSPTIVAFSLQEFLEVFISTIEIGNAAYSPNLHGFLPIESLSHPPLNPSMTTTPLSLKPAHSPNHVGAFGGEGDRHESINHQTHAEGDDHHTSDQDGEDSDSMSTDFSAYLLPPSRSNKRS